MARLGDDRFGAAQVDASDASSIVELARAERADVILNACDPWLNPPIFAAAAEAGCTYLDMAMTLSRRHPEKPFELTGVMLGDEQFAAHEEWEAAGRLALCGIGVEPGLSDVFARYAQDHLFSEIDEVGVRDGADLAVDGLRVRAHVLDLDDDRGVPEPAADLGARARLLHDGAVLRARGVRVPRGHRAGRVRQRRARGGGADPAPRRLPPRDVQVRARRGVHRRAAHAQQARAGLHRQAARQGRGGGAARRRGGRAAGPRDARRPA